jgi:hypothetical protein
VAVVVQSRAESNVTTAGTSHVVTLPSGVVSGDLVILFIGHAVSCTFNALTGWTELVDTAAANAEKIIYRLCDGTEGATVTFTSSASTKAAYLAWRISGALNPATQAPELSTVATGTSNVPDATAVTPTGGSKDYLFLTACVQAGEQADDDTWANTAPTNYTNLIQKTTAVAGTAATNCEVAGAERLLTASTENPGSFSVDLATAWRAWTIAVHPDPNAAVAPATVAAVATVPTPTIIATALTAVSVVAAISTVPAPTVIAEGGPVVESGWDEWGTFYTLDTSEFGRYPAGGDQVSETGARLFSLGIHATAVPTTVAAVASVSAPTVQADAEVDPDDLLIQASVFTPSIQIVPQVQKIRPDADQSIGTWTTDIGGTTNLWDALNEVTASDADYVKSAVNPTNNELIVTLTNPDDPLSSTGHVVRFRYRKTG